jgi:hypothetical protein
MKLMNKINGIIGKNAQLINNAEVDEQQPT